MSDNDVPPLVPTDDSWKTLEVHASCEDLDAEDWDPPSDFLSDSSDPVAVDQRWMERNSIPKRLYNEATTGCDMKSM